MLFRAVENTLHVFHFAFSLAEPNFLAPSVGDVTVQIRVYKKFQKRGVNNVPHVPKLRL